MSVKLRFTLYILISLVAVGSVSWIALNRRAHRERLVPLTRPQTSREAPLVLYFHRRGCPHCAAANPVMAELQRRYPKSGWLVTEVGPAMTPADRTAYESWLEAGELDGWITPLIIVGARDENTALFPGFSDELSDRQQIENEIRKRLGLAPVDLRLNSVDIPFYGRWLADDAIFADVIQLLGICSGVHPIAVTVFLLLVYFGARSRRHLFQTTAAYFLGLLVSEWMGWHLFNWRGDIETWTAVARLMAGAVSLLGAVVGLAVFVRSSAVPARQVEVFTCWWILLMAHLMDQSLTNWTLSLAADYGQASWLTPFTGWRVGAAGALVAVPIVHVLLIDLTPRARRVLCLLGGLLLLQIGLTLCCARNFSGYGAFWY